MSILKKYAMAVVAMVIAAASLTVMSFNRNDERAPEAQESTWFYQIDSMDPADLANPLNYGPNDPTANGCNGDEVVCNIQDIEDSSQPGHPALSKGNVLENETGYSLQLRQSLSR